MTYTPHEDHRCGTPSEPPPFDLAGTIQPRPAIRPPVLAPIIRPAFVAHPELAVVVPTFNKRADIAPLLDELRLALDGVDWEVIFVDDNSPDGTAKVARTAAREDRRIRVISRLGRRGLPGACLEGMLSTSAPVVAVLDAELQHDETCLPHMLGMLDMLDMLRRDQADLVIASRYTKREKLDESSFDLQSIGSRVVVSAARHMFGIEMTDPMSGVFMVRTEIVEDVAPRLSQQGFKIVLDIVLSTSTEIRIREIPYAFRNRPAGDSKYDSMVVAEFLGLILAKLSGNRLSIRFLRFAFAGFLALPVHLAALRLSLQFGLSFPAAQALALGVATTSNYLLSNLLTYRDRRHRGPRLLAGLVSYAAVSSLGFAAGVGTSSLLYLHDPSWWRAGIAGAVIGTGWNYLASRLVLWHGR